MEIGWGGHILSHMTEAISHGKRRQTQIKEKWTPLTCYNICTTGWQTLESLTKTDTTQHTLSHHNQTTHARLITTNDKNAHKKNKHKYTFGVHKQNGVIY